MTKEHYPQPLQFSLDDTEGATQERVSFEPCVGQDYVGKVKLIRTNTELPVYDSDGLAPDLSAIQGLRGSGSFGFAQSVSGQKGRRF
jgi:hypothetical protein